MSMKVLLAAAGVCAFGAAFGATIKSNTSGDTNSNDYDCFRYGQYVKSGKTVLLWEDGNPPSPENDYEIVGSGIINTPNYKTPATNFVFQGGSLTLKSGTLGLYTFQPSSIEFPESIGGLVVGAGATLRSRNTGSAVTSVRGKVVFESTSGNPAYIKSTSEKTNMATIQFDGKVVGKSTALITLDKYNPPNNPGLVRMALHGDCSEYFGAIRVNGCTNCLRIACAEFPGTARQVGPSRVELVGETMAVRFINQTNDKKCDIEIAPTSTVTMSKLTLADKGTIYCDYAKDSAGVGHCGSITVTNALDFLTVDAKVTIDVSGIPIPADPVEEHPSFTILKYTNGTIPLDNFTVKASTRGSAVIGSASIKGWGMLPNWEVAVTNFNDEVLGEVSALVVRAIPVVRRVSATNHNDPNDPTSWSDGLAPHDDVDYLVPYQSSQSLPWGGNKGPHYLDFGSSYPTFGGRSLTSQCKLNLKTALVQIDDLTMLGGQNYDGAGSHIYGDSNAAKDADGVSTHTFVGDVLRIYTSGTTSWGALSVAFRASAGRKLVIDSALQGTGNLTIEHPHQDKPKSGGFVFLKRDNSGFTGRLRVSDMTAHKSYTDEPSRDNNITLLVSDENQIGGKMSSFTYNALFLSRWGCLQNIGDLAFTTAANRGLYVEGHGHVRTPEGTTLSLNQRLTMAGELYKSGKGTLALGATTAPTFTSSRKAYSDDYAGTNVVTVADGGLLATTKEATEGLAVTFVEKGSLMVDPNATGDMAAYGYCATAAGCALASDRADGAIPLSFKWPAGADPAEFTATVCTVPSDKPLMFTLAAKPFSSAALKSVEAVDNGDGTTTYKATVFPSGMMIFVK